MARGKLIYRWDEQAGRMRLDGRTVRLSERDRLALEAELGRQYESLLARLDRGESGPLVPFGATVMESRCVTGFRVRYRHSQCTRCPDLVLRPVPVLVGGKATAAGRAKARNRSRRPNRSVPAEDPRALGPRAASAAQRDLAIVGDLPWVAGFVADVKQQLSEMTRGRLTNADRAAIAFTFAELQDLCRDRPEELATILLAGYVSLGERLGETDPEQARWYRSAARVLEKLCGREARTAPEPASPAPPVTFEESVGPIRRLTRFLGRVLGLQDEEAWD